MAYVLPCNRPEFRQGVPKGDGWRLARDGEPQHPGGVNWINDATGEHVLAPAIWYNLPGSRYAESLRYNADRSDECADRKEAEGAPWSAGEVEHFRRQARRLRAMALLCDRHPDIPASHIEFRGLSDPTTPRHVEDSTVARIEAEPRP